MKQSGRGVKAHTKAAQAHENKDRKSGSGVSGMPKKGGHGGKFTWAGDGLLADHQIIASSAIDVNDPNFEDSVVDETTTNTVAAAANNQLNCS